MNPDDILGHPAVWYFVIILTQGFCKQMGSKQVPDSQMSSSYIMYELSLTLLDSDKLECSYQIIPPCRFCTCVQVYRMAMLVPTSEGTWNMGSFLALPVTILLKKDMVMVTHAALQDEGV